MNRVLIAAVLVAACKRSHSDEARTGSASPPVAAPVSAPPPRDGIEKVAVTEGDGARAAEIATRYMHAMGTRDWAGACATRPKSERDEMARIAGSCEKAFAMIGEKQPVEMMANVVATAVRRRGTQWAVDFNQPGQARPMGTLIVTRDGDSWFVIDVPDDQNF